MSRGDFVVVGVLLAVVAGLGDWRSAAAVGLATIATLTRWHTASLTALAGAQAVFGPAGLTGPIAAALSSWAAAGALLLAAPVGWASAPFGLAAALVLAGPSGASLGGLLVRLLGAVAMVDLAVSVGRRVPVERRQPPGVAVGAVAVVLAWLGRP